MEHGNAGWSSSFDDFSQREPRVITASLKDFVGEVSKEQLRAWSDSIPELQWRAKETIALYNAANQYSMILEYRLPLDQRRPDVIVLKDGSVIVLEIKGKPKVDLEDIDQVSAYARDLRCYHRECQWPNRTVHPVLMPMQYNGTVQDRNGVHICSPEDLPELVQKLESGSDLTQPDIQGFLSPEAYCPLPTLITAARELFDTGDLRPIKRARAATDPAVERITHLIHEAANERSRKLILVSGIPGAGKTLVGLRVVHSRFLDDLRESETGGAPAVFLSGNGPLVQVLQYELRGAGGGGKTFVRDVKAYRERLMKNPELEPDEHVVVSDEAQRAWDAQKMDKENEAVRQHRQGWSEPDYFVEFSDRKRDWSVIVALIGSGQEIHDGEESGITQWAHAIERSPKHAEWKIHGPEHLLSQLGTSIATVPEVRLHLDTEVRYHAAEQLSMYVDQLLGPGQPQVLLSLAESLENSGFHLRITRNFTRARRYLDSRYGDSPDARFGILASSRDKDLEKFGIPNSFQATKQVKIGPWFGDPESSALSCRTLRSAVTEFGCQGLELDAALLAWGTDFMRESGRWSSERMRKYKTPVQDAHQLRVNAYRVLLTRGRDGVVVFIPSELDTLDETYAWLCSVGFQEID